jgi:hypothetical protein
MTKSEPPKTSLGRIIGGGFVASLVSGLLGGIVLGICVFLGSIGLELLEGTSSLAELSDKFGLSMLMYAMIGGAFGLALGTILALVLGHIIIWFTRNDIKRRRPLGLLVGSVFTALIVGIGNMSNQLGPGILREPGIYTLILMMSISGALAGACGVLIFLTVRSWFVPVARRETAPTLSPSPL